MCVCVLQKRSLDPAFFGGHGAYRTLSFYLGALTTLTIANYIAIVVLSLCFLFYKRALDLAFFGGHCADRTLASQLSIRSFYHLDVYFLESFLLSNVIVFFFYEIQ